LPRRQVIADWNQIANWPNLSVHTTKKLHYQHRLPVRKLPTGGRIALVTQLEEWLRTWQVD